VKKNLVGNKTLYPRVAVEGKEFVEEREWPELHPVQGKAVVAKRVCSELRLVEGRGAVVEKK
jgi:hypothetical protein